MAGKKSVAPVAAANPMDITGLFEQELQARNEDLRRQAALNMFYKLHPSNKVNVEQFIAGIKQHKDVWAVVSTMGIVDFAEALSGGKRAATPGKEAKPARRTRLNENQKTTLKQVIVKTLSDSKDGLNRNEIARSFSNEQLASINIGREELANKLRQLFFKDMANSKIYTVGEKCLMKYLVGGAGRKKN